MVREALETGGRKSFHDFASSHRVARIRSVPILLLLCHSVSNWKRNRLPGRDTRNTKLAGWSSGGCLLFILPVSGPNSIDD